MVTEESKTQDDKEDVLATARKRFQLAEEAYSEIEREAVDDMRFLAGDQWPEEIKRDRELRRRPCLTINRLPQYLRQVTNDQRQNRPSIKVNPVDEKADPETAEVLQGMIRHIEYDSNAEVAYDRAFDGSAGGGLGYMRVITDYCDPYSFDQALFIKSIRNPRKVKLDPNHQEPDGSDANWGFVFDDMDKDEFIATYPNAKLSTPDGWESFGSTYPNWIRRDTVRIAEYFYKTFKKLTICLLSNGQVVSKDELQEDLPEGMTVVAERETIEPAIKWCKLNGLEILEETDWLGIWIPIIPVIGDEIEVDGKLKLSGVIRHAKDSQRMYNYWASTETETIALAPKAPWVGFSGQFEGFEAKWNTANIDNHPYLEVNSIDENGNQVPLPQRNVYEPAIQAITLARRESSEDIKATTGIYDASLGNRSNEQSGIAIDRRNRQAQTNNFHFQDNMARSQKHLGRILVDLIPKVYTEPQAVRTIGEDGKIKMVDINRIFKDEKGKEKIYRLNYGKYDVTISSGPSFQTKQQEDAQNMLELSKSAPIVMQAAPDIFVRTILRNDMADELAQRLKKTLPPGLADDDSQDQMPLPPQVKQQLQQMNQMIDQLTNELNQKTELVKTKTLELESKERIEMAKIQADIEIELAKMGSQEAQILLKTEVAEIQRRLDQLNYNQPIEIETEQGGGNVAAQLQNQQPTGGGPSPGQFMGE